MIGVGAVPATGLAEAAGLALDNGIAVDARLRSSDPHIFAAGDCCSFPLALYGGRRVRLEAWRNAQEQGALAARNMLGAGEAYDAVPWFWSDQYELKLQMVGLSQGYDAVVLRGTPASRSFIAFYLKGGVVLAADSVSRPQDFMAAKKLVAERVKADAGVLADESRPLKELLAPAA